jgi:molecular chaperone HscB
MAQSSHNPDAPQNYFAQFNLPRHLHIDTAALEKAFYAQSRRLHPDRFASRPQSEQEAALAASSQLNDAYRTLKDPIARTEYLLQLEGIQLEEQSRAATDAARASGTEKKQVAPSDLLEEAFELNMQLEEMRMARQMGEDDPSTRADLESARTRFTAMLQDAQSQLESLWSQWDLAEDSNDPPARDRAKQAMVALLNRRSYIRNLVRDVNAALE